MTTKDKQQLGFTALYTSQAWIWGGLPEAELFDSPSARAIFHGVTSIYRLARWLRPGMAPILPALLHRHRMIDHLLEREDAPQVLELAAGLSPRGAHYSGDSALTYTEVDLPKVIDVKERLLGRSARGREIAARPNLHFVGEDVTRMSLDAVLDRTRAAFVVAEGLHMYLPVEAQRQLWTRIASALGRGRGGVFVFDHFRRPPSERPGRLSRAVLSTMKAWQQRIGFVPDHRTTDEVVRDLEQAGFDRIEVFTSREKARQWRLPHADVSTDVVLFLASREKPA